MPGETGEHGGRADPAGPRAQDARRALRDVEPVADAGAPAVPGGSDATRPPTDRAAPRDPDFERLLAEPGLFDAATAIRVAEARAAVAGLPLRIAAPPSNRLAPTAIAGVAETAEEVRVETPLMGLVGALSPLPPAYTEVAARDRRRGAGGLAAFLDVFSGRLAQLYVAAAERPDMARLLRWHPPGRNRIVAALHALIGFGTPGMERLRPLPGDETLRHVAVLAGRIRSAEGLRAILAAELGLPVEVEQFRLRWRRLPRAELTVLGGTKRVDDAAAAGERAPDRGGQVRVRVGPVRYADFLSLGEGQERLRRLRALARLHLGPVIDFEVQVVLDRRDVPATQLGGDGPAPRLGWNAWARTLPARRDADEVVLGSAPRGAAA
jgi:type VI secretion system protein ImpH